MRDDPHGSQARKRQYQAMRLMPNRHEAPLDATEAMAEASDGQRTMEAAKETGNWPLVGALDALRKEARKRRKTTIGDQVILDRDAFNR